MPRTMEVFLQSLLSFFVLFVLARIMGKRQMSRLTFFDYISGITIGNIAASWSLDDVKSVDAMVGLLVWSILSLVLAYIQRKSYRGRILLDGRPTVIVRNGQIMEDSLRKERLSFQELMALLRRKNVFKLSDVEYAVFETNGELNVMKKTDLQSLTPRDAGVPVVQEHEPTILIIDGHVMERSLREAGYDRAWLLGEIMKHGARDFTDVFIAQVDSNGDVYVDMYRDEMTHSPVKAKPWVSAQLKKIQADLEMFALQTENRDAKQAYAEMAGQLDTLIDRMAPYLRQ